MLGNAAVARGLYEAGCCFISSYPGTPSTEITEEAAKYKEIFSEWAPNEKVATEAAFGASLAGRRAACAMKHVGLNVASDCLYSMSYTGINAGLVVCVADDAGLHSSQNEQDSRHHAIASKVPMLEPSDSQESLEFTKLAFEISEQFDTPVLLKMCTRVSHSQSLVETSDRVLPEFRPYKKDIRKYVMMPANSKPKHPVVEKRMVDLLEYAENTPINRVEMADSEVGIITASTSYQYVKEAFGDSVSVLKLGMANPMPVKLIKDFASKVKKLYVVEELDPVIENHVKALGIEVTGKDILPLIYEYSQNMVSEALGKKVEGAVYSLDEQVPARPPVMCPGCPHRGMFYTLNRNKVNALGDIGCYTLGAVAPLSASELCLDMGSSVSATHGFNAVLAHEGKQELGEDKTVAVIGDSTFMHSGMTSLADIAYNQSNSTVIILDNSTTGMTGHQNNPTNGLNIHGEPAGCIDLTALCNAMGIKRVRVVDPYNLEECDRVLKEELKEHEPSVIISRRPCALLKTVKHNAPLKVNTDKCIGCKSCMRVGCPAVTIKNGKAAIDSTLCVGCNVCSQLCPVGAFESSEKEAK